MKKYIMYLSVLLISLVSSAYAYDYNTQPSYTNQNYQLNKNTSLKKYDYTQDAYKRNKIIRPYVGISGYYTDFKFTSQQGYALDRPGTFYKDNAFGLAGIIGTKFHKYFGIEFFYRQTFKESKITRIASEGSTAYDAEGTTLLNAYGTDLLVFLPIHEQVDFLASIGIGKYNLKTEMKDQVSVSGLYNNYIESKKVDTKGTRIGTGIQYNIKEEIYMRGMIHYVKMSDEDYIKHLIEVSLGLYYMF